MSGAFGSVLLHLIEAKEMQFCGSFSLTQMNILFNESRLEQICRALRHGAISSNNKKTVLLFIRISIDI